ncbi:MAG: indolepyruvate ferredoxin oxidoreductase subunit alpha [Candidatus Methanofastidiosa archaeon]|nr:indolepyruvate ferredoxin oxidoreductase subunit alpha [Candidatus Methanofastidiosa archaeon]
MKLLLMGNEAIGRGAIEAGVNVVAAYPGTPSSEIPEYISRHAKENGIFMEYSTNEKVSLEVCIGTSWSGLRSMATMKHVGLNVASDALMTLTYTGVVGGLLLVSADDPSCHSSQNEQDNRYYSLLANIPTLEPSSPQEAYEMAKEAFAISEELCLPVMLRPTTRTCHCRADVEVGKVVKRDGAPEFKRDVTHRVTIPAHARIMHPELLGKVEKARGLFEKSHFNSIEGKGKIGIIGSGISYAYVKEALGAIEEEVSVFKLGTLHPLPTNRLLEFLKDKEKVLVVEEMEPILEWQLKALAHDNRLKVKIYGKDVIPRVGELNTNIVRTGIREALAIGSGPAQEEVAEMPDLPPRPPMLCPGCPHRATFYCMNKTSKKWIKPSDIGCYTLGIMPPLNAVDTTFCMGASIGISCGFAAAGNKEIIASIGDSTFFHTGIPPLIDAVYNKHNITVVILDNRTTAMTGHQPNPGTGLNATMDPAPMIDLVRVCDAIGAFTQLVDPYDLDVTMDALRKANEHEGPAVVVAKRPCILLEKRPSTEAGYHVNQEKCTGCSICLKELGCPAMLFNREDKKASIDDLLCVNCGVCAQVCPYDAIEV